MIEAGKTIYFTRGSQEIKDWHIPRLQALARAIGKDLKYGWYQVPISNQFRNELVDENNALYRSEDYVGYEARQWIYGNGSIVPRRFAKVFSSDYTAFDWTQLPSEKRLISLLNCSLFMRQCCFYWFCKCSLVLNCGAGKN